MRTSKILYILSFISLFVFSGLATGIGSWYIETPGSRMTFPDMQFPSIEILNGSEVNEIPKHNFSLSNVSLPTDFEDIWKFETSRETKKIANFEDIEDNTKIDENISEIEDIENNNEFIDNHDGNYDVYIYQKDDFIIAKTSDDIELAKVGIGSDSVELFKTAIDSVPNDGSLHVGKGHYVVSAPYEFPLNPDGSNIFYVCLPILDKSMYVSGDGPDETIIQMAPGQRSPSRHVVMVLIRATKAYDLGYSNFEFTGLTLDGNRAQQTDGQPHDGEGLILSGSLRKNGKYHDIKLINSHGSGIYSGNNGAGPESDAIFYNIFSQNCGAEGIILDTCHNSHIYDCVSLQCREGFCLYGNDDWQTRSTDQVSLKRSKTDSQVTVWQVNNFLIDDIEMDCTNTIGSYGLMIRDGTGNVENSVFKSNPSREDSTGGATYVYEGSHVLFDNCELSGYYGIHAFGRAYVESKNCRITAPGGCYCTLDFDPVQSTIVAENCEWSGEKLAMKDGATFIEK